MKHFLLIDPDNEYGFVDDPLSPARGIALAVVISAAIILLVVAAIRWLV